MKSALALLIEAAETRDSLDVWLVLEAALRDSAGLSAVAGPLEDSVCSFRLCFWAGPTMFQSSPVAAEPQALAAADAAEPFPARRAASTLDLSSSRAPSSSGAPKAESSVIDHLSRVPSEALELAANESWKVSGPASEVTFEASIFLG